MRIRRAEWLAAAAGAAVLLAGCSAPVPAPATSAGHSAASETAPGTGPSRPASPSGPSSAGPVPEPSGWLTAASGGTGQLVLLGDSFAAGEGAGGYRPAVPGTRDSCHRSRHAAGAELFAPENVANLACSRAAAGHLQSAQRLRVTDPLRDAATVPAQLDQLQDLQPTLVMVSLGGNNLDFSGLLQACLLETQTCSEDPQLRADTAAQLSTLQPVLTNAYDSVAATVSAPILVLPYPQLFDDGLDGPGGPGPGSPDGGCGRLAPEEQAFARQLITELNAVIRSAVDSSAAANVHYVADVEDALAGHGACSADPWVHSPNVNGLLEAAHSPAADQELLHPTRNGYRAMTGALVRWAEANPGSQ